MKGKVCSADFCDINKDVSNFNKTGFFYCKRHYSQIRKYGKIIKTYLDIDKICSEKNCNNTKLVYNYKKTGKFFCKRHLDQLYLYGKTKETRFEPNKFVEKEKYYEIILKNNDLKEVSRALIDKRDYNAVKNHKWSDDRGYVHSWIDGKRTKLHRFLLKPKKDEIIDHINKNPLDNRRFNLRITTISVNCFNIKLKKNNTSGKTGISQDKDTNKWRARIMKNGRAIYLGTFKRIKDAIKVRKEAELKYYGFNP